MRQAFPLMILSAACAPSHDDLVPPRIVLLSYAAQPTSADSAALHAIAGGVVTMYPLIDAMTVMTPLPTSVFTTLTPTPGRITDFDSLRCAMDLELTVTSTFGAADSIALAAAGFPHFYTDHRDGYADSDVTPATFPFINHIAASSDIIAGHIYYDCTFAERRATLRHGADINSGP